MFGMQLFRALSNVAGLDTGLSLTVTTRDMRPQKRISCAPLKEAKASFGRNDR